MFEISIDNRNHTNAVGDSMKAGPQAAHAAHDKVDLHAGLAGGIKFFDDRGIDEAVHFGNNTCGLPGTRLFGFPPNESDEVFPQAARCQHQVMKFLWPSIASQQVEEICEILAKAFSASKKSDVAVNTARTSVIVTGREMTIAPNAVGLLPDHETRLAMGLIANQSVHHVSAYFFQRSGPRDIRLLIETGLKFHQDRYLFAGFGRAQ